MNWVTTTTILDRMRRPDDQDAWKRFHERFRRPLLSFARRFGLPDADTEDICQEILTAFLEAYQSGKYQREKGRLSSWLFGIAYQQISNRRRQIARQALRRDARSESFWEDVPDQTQASREWDAEWEKATLETCLQQVREEVAANTFDAFRLVVREGRSPDEAAHSLSMTRDAIYVAKHRDATITLRERDRELGDEADMIDVNGHPVDVKTMAFILLIQDGPPANHGSAISQVEASRRAWEAYANGPATGGRGRFDTRLDPPIY